MTSPPSGRDHFTARTARAVTAAIAAGRDAGLTVEAATVLHDVFSVIVHLAPARVVARVPVVLPPGLALDAQRARQRRELAVVGWLADRGHPVVRPSPLVPREPVVRGGSSITLWEHVEVDAAARADITANTSRVALLHAALRRYPGALPFLAPVAITIPPCLAFLEAHPGLLDAPDLERARREWQVLAPAVSSEAGFAAACPGVSVQPIHGDAPYYNVIPTSAGPLDADFEDVTLGPVEWDLAMAGAEGVAAYDAAADRAGVRRANPGALRVMEAARMLQLVACMALVPQLPMLRDGLAPMLQAWRTMPVAGGLNQGGAAS